MLLEFRETLVLVLSEVTRYKAFVAMGLVHKQEVVAQLFAGVVEVEPQKAIESFGLSNQHWLTDDHDDPRSQEGTHCEPEVRGVSRLVVESHELTDRGHHR